MNKSSIWRSSQGCRTERHHLIYTALAQSVCELQKHLSLSNFYRQNTLKFLLTRHVKIFIDKTIKILTWIE